MNAVQRKILVMAGGTGGHVYPALAVAQALQEGGYDIEWLGTRAGLEARVVPQAGIKLNYLHVAGFRGKGVIARLKAMFFLVISLCESLAILLRYRPGCVLGMGGYASAPGGLISWLLRRPLVIHEQNAVAGSTNRMLAPLAKRICVAYPDAFGAKRDVFETGNPVRRDIERIHGDESGVSTEHAPLRILVLGGSLGAQALNEVMPDLMTQLPANSCELWHQCGPRHLESVSHSYGQSTAGIRLDAYIEDMAQAYAWADLAICRAGALTCAELAMAGIPAILIPLPGAIDDHQTVNARWLVQGGAAEILVQSEMSAPALAERIQTLSADRSTLIAMTQAARKMARPNAVDDIARICREVYRGE